MKCQANEYPMVMKVTPGETHQGLFYENDENYKTLNPSQKFHIYLWKDNLRLNLKINYLCRFFWNFFYQQYIFNKSRITAFKLFCKFSEKSQENRCDEIKLFVSKVPSCSPAICKIQAPLQVFFFEFYKRFLNLFLTENLRATAFFTLRHDSKLLCVNFVKCLILQYSCFLIEVHHYFSSFSHIFQY